MLHLFEWQRRFGIIRSGYKWAAQIIMVQLCQQREVLIQSNCVLLTLLAVPTVNSNAMLCNVCPNTPVTNDATMTFWILSLVLIAVQAQLNQLEMSILAFPFLHLLQFQIPSGVRCKPIIASSCSRTPHPQTTRLYLFGKKGGTGAQEEHVV